VQIQQLIEHKVTVPVYETCWYHTQYGMHANAAKRLL